MEQETRERDGGVKLEEEKERQKTKIRMRKTGGRKRGVERWRGERRKRRKQSYRITHQLVF